MICSKAVLVSLLLLLSSYNMWGQVTADSTVSSVIRLYNDGIYERAELEARRALSADTALPPHARTELEKYLAFSLVAEGRNQEGKQHFIEALDVTPDLTLDPILVSPKLIAVFNEAKSEFRELQKNQPAATSSPTTGVSWRVLVYPGWEQYNQGRTTKGIGIAVLETALIAATIVLEANRASARNSYLSAVEASDIASKYNTYNNVRKAEIYVASAAIFVWVYAELDAFLHLPPSFEPPRLVVNPSDYRPSGVQFRFRF
jgi:hypothetical protein